VGVWRVPLTAKQLMLSDGMLGKAESAACGEAFWFPKDAIFTEIKQ
jgi:hypothetical protein